MAKTYRVSPFVKTSNAMVAALLRLGVKVGDNILLTVPGRKSGEPRTTPVTILHWNGERWLQSPFGEVNWVRNLRASGQATLTRGRRSESVAVVEQTPVEAAQVYKGTIASFPSMIKAYFDVTPDSTIAEFEKEALRHPMFRVIGAPATPPSSAL
jgi:deazaflavin-dependent oxidoreductase (nitroreductase family)